MTVFAKLHRNLDPLDTLAELIFGLLMVLTFTLGARLLGPEELVDGRELLIAAIGCNIAWGIIDGFLFLLGRIFERRRIASTFAAIATLGDDDAGLNAVRNELASELTELGNVDDRERFYASIAAAARRHPPPPIRVTLKDLSGAALVFCLVVATAIPAALPFLIVSDPYLALRLSNAVLVVLLFLAGYWWGKHIGASPLVAGALIMSIGVVLVLIAIPLGG
jgi:VIT1/CCC1 family predicted Fe2+/Mn2+ transporter